MSAECHISRNSQTTHGHKLTRETDRQSIDRDRAETEQRRKHRQRQRHSRDRETEQRQTDSHMGREMWPELAHIRQPSATASETAKRHIVEKAQDQH